jgi:hypothetical protein
MRTSGLLSLTALTFALLLALGPLAHAQKLHAVLVGDTLNAQVGSSAIANLEHFKAFLAIIRAVGEIDVGMEEIKDQAFNCKSIQYAVKRLMTVGANDAVLFYYSGPRGQLPELPCAYPTERLGLGELIGELRDARSAHFLLSVVDPCNEGLPSNLPLARVHKVDSGIGKDWQRQAFKRLFLEYEGVLAMSGSVPDESAYCVNEGKYAGGIFSNQFLGAIYGRISMVGPEVRWEDIAAEAGAKIEIRTSEAVLLQHPQFDIALRERM